MGVGSSTFSSYLTRTEVWGETPSVEGKDVEGGAPSAGRFLGIYFQNNPLWACYS